MLLGKPNYPLPKGQSNISSGCLKILTVYNRLYPFQEGKEICKVLKIKH